MAILLHGLLSDPLLGIFGFHYSGDGRWFEKLHPGSILIYVAFVWLLLGKRQCVEYLLCLAKEERALFSLLLVYVLLLLYMSLRSGVTGIAFIIDIHITALLAVILLRDASLSLCRRGLWLFIFLAMANSLIGITEALLHARLFGFDSNWVVMGETYFRPSALLGHPLNNACFTAVMLFVVLAVPIGQRVRFPLVMLFLLSLLAFGGRAALLVSLGGMAFFLFMKTMSLMLNKQVHLLRLFTLSAIVLLLLSMGVLLGHIFTSHEIGSRIASHLYWDESANSRLLVLSVLDYMRWPEIIFGVPAERIIDLVERLGGVMQLSDIENPWVMMFLYTGLLFFPIWLLTFIGFIVRCGRGQPLALQLAICTYFLIASTYNSFGRKDSVYLLMIAVVTCAANALKEAHADGESAC